MKPAESSSPDLLMVEKDSETKTNTWVYQLLRTNFLCGKIEPGIPLTIRGLAETLGVSPMPVREALHRLTCEGAVEAKDNRRVIVPLMTEEKFHELCELRVLIESYAAASALPYITDQHIKDLERIDARIDIAIREQNTEGLSLSNQNFHRTLYTANPNQISVPLIESLWLQLGPFSRIAIRKLEKVYIVDRHREAIEALKRRSVFALRRAIEADIRDGIASINAIVGIEDYLYRSK